MAYGKIKADTLVYDNSGTDTDVTIASLGNKADLNSPTFTGTPAAPTAAANTNTTQIATTAYVQTELGDYATLAAPALTGTATAVNLTLSGNLTVNGTTTTIDSTTLTVEDKNIELGKVGTPTDTTADGGGITLKGATDKTFNWVDATDAWTSSEHIHLGDNKKLLVGTGSDLEIFHNGSHSLINDAGTGNIRLQVGGTTQFEVASTGVTVSGTVTDTKGELRNIPQNNQTSAYTLVATDAGKHIRTNSNVTVPDNIFAIGDAITIFNNSGSDITITQGSNVTMNNAADAATGNRTLASKGLATLLCHYADSSNNDEFVISGAGLS